MSASQDLTTAPEPFREALASIGRARFPREMDIHEIPTPKHLAPYGVSLAAQVDDPEEHELALGRFVLLHDPEAPESWGGDFRVVTYIRARVERDVASEGLLSSVAWDWLLEALERQQACYSHEGGTLTRAFSQGFGSLAHGENEEETVQIELRASWTPEGPSARRHLEAWSEMVCTYAGLPPLPEDVVRFPRGV